MDTDHQLAQNVTSESKAYGYTLTVWGGGAILSHVFGAPDPLQILCYVGGALLGFGAVLLLTFNSLVVDSSIGSQTAVPSMVHLAATFGSIAGVYLLARVVSAVSVPPVTAFLASGFVTALAYNLLLPVETSLIRTVAGSDG